MEDVVQALENWTSFRWGMDCLIWVVHYTDEVVEPWVEAEAARANFNETQKKEYRRAFISELRMNEAESFLVSIYSFGAVPLALRPFGNQISLVKSNGERLKPTSYERVFDEPISGMVQGLVFFPKQSDKDFSLALKGTGVFSERTFSFPNQVTDHYNTSIAASAPSQEDLIVIDMPPAPPRPSPPRKDNRRNEATPLPVVIEEKPRTETIPEIRSVPEIEIIPVSADFNVAEQMANDRKNSQERDNLYISREKTLQNFINSWIANDAPAMYAMLSDESRKLYSPESFEREVRRLTDFRRGLLSGYRIDWLGEERAKVTTTKKLLVMRTLINKTLGVVRMGREWRIVW